MHRPQQALRFSNAARRRERPPLLLACWCAGVLPSCPDPVSHSHSLTSTALSCHMLPAASKTSHPAPDHCCTCSLFFFHEALLHAFTFYPYHSHNSSLACLCFPIDSRNCTFNPHTPIGPRAPRPTEPSSQALAALKLLHANPSVAALPYRQHARQNASHRLSDLRRALRRP